MKKNSSNTSENIIIWPQFHVYNLFSKCFRLCDPLDRKNDKDVSYLFEILADNFATIVQYNKDNRHYKNPERSSVTLETLCDIMVNKSIPTPVSLICSYMFRFCAGVDL